MDNGKLQLTVENVKVKFINLIIQINLILEKDQSKVYEFDYKSYFVVPLKATA